MHKFRNIDPTHGTRVFEDNRTVPWGETVEAISEEEAKGLAVQNLVWEPVADDAKSETKVQPAPSTEEA